MSDYCKCKDCKYCDPSETTSYGEKTYCDYYHTYEYPNEVRECKAYRKN